MKRQSLLNYLILLLLLLCSIALGNVQASSLSETLSANEHLKAPCVFFDKSVYYPDVQVFCNKNASKVSMKLSVIDRYVGSQFVKVKVFSSLDMEKVILPKVDAGKFECSVLATCLKHSETALDEDAFNVRFGDVIDAKFVGCTLNAAFVAFPPYVLDGEFISLSPWKLFDSEGVPLVNYGYPIGIQYNPVTISQYALTNYHMYLATENASFKETFLVQANWLVKNAAQKGDFSVWEYKFNWPSYKATNPWVSAMAQGEGMSVLTRAYVLTGNQTYLDVAETAMRSFEVEMSTGGVRYTDKSGVWYEEGADIGAPSSKVLNGLLFALFGLYEYSFESNNTRAYKLFLEGSRTLSANLYRYDTGSWSYYDLYYYSRASMGYHKLHVNQLMTLYKLTGDQTFLYYSNKFNSYIH